MTTSQSGDLANEISFRPAVAADAAGIARVHLDTWRERFIPIMTPEQVARKDLNPDSEFARWQARLTREPERTTLVAEQGRPNRDGAPGKAPGTVVGFTTGGAPHGDSYDYDAELYQLYVLPAYQSQGIGRVLVRELAVALSAKGFRRMLVWVVTINPAVRFYRDILGGVYLGERPIPEVDGTLIEAAYGWSDLSDLVNPGRV